MAIDLADYSGADLLKDDSSFHMFFVRNRLAPEHGRWTVSNEPGIFITAILIPLF